MLKIKVLIAFANPHNTERLELEREDRVIHEAIKLSHYRESIELTIRHAVTIHDLRRILLEETFDIIHISGHGFKQGIVLENESGEPIIVPHKALVQALSEYNPSVQCVILNSCHSISLGKSTSQIIPFIILMKGQISDEGAIEFSRGFYDAIGAKQPIEDFNFAYEEGRRTVKLAAPQTNFVSKLITGQPKTQSGSKTLSLASTLTEPKSQVLAANLVLVDASLDPHDCPYEQTIENGVKVIKYKHIKFNRQ